MSVRSTSGSSSSSQASATPAFNPVVAPGSLNTITEWYDSCTFIKEKDVKNSYGCYLFRSCQSCLETDGCMLNDLGICVSQTQGMTNLETGDYQYSTSYYSEMNYLKAIENDLALPNARASNLGALVTEQNWHFRAGEATYCAADDAVCTECTANNFWRGNDTSEMLSDSRFCVGANGCVCIQTCEVPSFKSSTCQWKLSAPSPSPTYGGYYGGYYDSYNNVTHLAFWEWLIVVLVVVAIHLIFRCCSGSSEKRQLEAARAEAVRAVRRELGIPETEAVTAPVRTAPVLRPLRRTTTEATDDSSDHEDDNVEEVKTPRHGDDASTTESQSVFVEIQDMRPAPLSSRTDV